MNTDDVSAAAQSSAATSINGFPATYVCIRAADGDYTAVKVLNVPDYTDNPNPNPNPSPGPGPNPNPNPDQQLITQHRCGNLALASRTINPALYTDDQLEWFVDPDPKIPEPMRLVIIEMLRCYLCGDRQAASGNDSVIHHESAGEHVYGYRMCTECKTYFRKSLFKQIAPIWRFRLLHETVSNINQSYTRVPVWVARTRYDNNGVRIRSSLMPYKYSQWTIIRWVTIKYHDNYKAERDPAYSGEDCVMIESLNELLVKLISVSDLFIINYGSIADPEYDPNVDDPMNRYSDDEKARLLAEAVSLQMFE